ncbi:sensor histidine kinase [Denitromonas halophila]|uniref:histidine kinase n=1 Tax=Denitromonas halophila TaxID=1629404 RepID=A0A557QK03_9RHOO|nr:sensor histidine kinase [Denitromonas halophila]TVO53197.1 sensor histidine kinase [Denitromonas halophila]
MDLRHKLVLYLGAALMALLAVACTLVLTSLREDVAEEMAASSHLATLLLAVAERGPQALGAIGTHELRHLAVEQERPDMERPLQNESLALVDAIAAWLPGDDAEPAAEQRFSLGADTFVIRADPRSEIDEIVHDASRLLAALAAFGVLSLLSVWWAVGRALSPVRDLERRLEAIGEGCFSHGAASFELPEFDRISRAIDQLAAKLAAAQAREGDLTRRLITVQEEERRDIARELHDELGQSLVAIAASASYIERNAMRAEPSALAESAATIRGESGRVQAHVRELLARLKPHGLEHMGVLAAVREHAHGWAARAVGITTTIDLPGALPRLSAPAALALYRTLQEALTNVLKHSGATQVRIALEAVGQHLRMCVIDNGRGRAAAVARDAGNGIRGMRERAAMVGGLLRIEDAQAAGVMIAWELPLDATKREGA